MTVSRPSTLLRVFLMGGSRYPTKGGNWGKGGGSSCKPKSFELSPSDGYYTHQKIESPCPSLDHRPHIEKKVSLIVFRQILPKILLVVCIFSYTIMMYLKKLVETKSLSTKQCPAGSSPRIIPHYPPKHLWETLGMGEYPTQQPKIYSFPPLEKSFLISLHFLFSKVSFLPHSFCHS